MFVFGLTWMERSFTSSRTARRTRDGIYLSALIILVGSVPLADWAVAQDKAPQLSEAVREVVGITGPHKEATLAAVHPGRIARIASPEGSVVEEGKLVFALDDGVQQAAVRMAGSKAETTLDVELAQARWERAQNDLDRLLKLHGNENATSKELNDARSEARITRLEYELARFAHGQLALAYQREQELLDQYHARAPFTGYVAEHLKHEGESVEESEGVIRLVQVDPLKVLVDCPLTLAPSIREGDRVRVRPLDTRWDPRWGSVVLASRVADGASQTFKVKLTVPNEDAAWMSGLKVMVEFPEDNGSDATVSSRAPQPTMSSKITGPEKKDGDGAVR